MIRADKLKGCLVSNNRNVEWLSELLGIDKTTFYRKLKATDDTFTVGQVGTICKALNLSQEEVMNIFFADYIA